MVRGLYAPVSSYFLCILVQVLKARLAALAYLAENFNFSWTSAECIVAELVEKIGDVKNGQGCKDVLTAAAEATDFPKVCAHFTWASLILATVFGHLSYPSFGYWSLFFFEQIYLEW